MKNIFRIVILISLFIASLFFIFLGLFISLKQETKPTTNQHFIQWNDDEAVIKMVPKEIGESPEVTKYRNDLKLWLEWNDECMGMDPKSKPKDPRNGTI